LDTVNTVCNKETERQVNIFWKYPGKNLGWWVKSGGRLGNRKHKCFIRNEWV